MTDEQRPPDRAPADGPPEGAPGPGPWEATGAPRRKAWDEGAPKGRRLSCTLAIIAAILFLLLPLLAWVAFFLLPAGTIPGSGFVQLSMDDRVAFVGTDYISGEPLFTVTLKERVADAEGLRLACDNVKPALGWFAGSDGAHFQVKSWHGQVIATDETPCP